MLLGFYGGLTGVLHVPYRSDTGVVGGWLRGIDLLKGIHFCIILHVLAQLNIIFIFSHPFEYSYFCILVILVHNQMFFLTQCYFTSITFHRSKLNMEINKELMLRSGAENLFK